jgi:hypothetical protein
MAAAQQELLSLQFSLEILNGPFAGQKIPVAEGQTVTVGRTHRSNFRLAHDTFLSGVHFSLQLGAAGCLLVDRHSANGTFVNGTRVAEVELRDGDEVMAGSTKFKAKVEVAPLHAAVELPAPPSSPVPPAAHPPPAAAETPVPTASIARGGLSIGSWTFGSVPEEWEQVEAYGIRSSAKAAFPPEAMVAEDVLASGSTFEQYVESQLSLVREFVAEAQIEKAASVAVQGASETQVFTIRYATPSGQCFLQRQIYVRAGKRVGVVTFTTLESELPKFRPVLDGIVAGLTLKPDAEA